MKRRFRDFHKKCEKQLCEEFWNTIRNNPDKIYDWKNLSSHKLITLEIILNNLELPWIWERVPANINITIKDIKERPELPWDIKDFSKNPTITIKDINENPDVEWSWRDISFSPSITWQDILANPDREWDWGILSRKKGLTCQIYEKLSHKPFNIINLTTNNSITWDLFNNLNIPRCPVFSSCLSQHNCITLEIIKSNPRIYWDYSSFSENINVTPKIVEENPDIPWDYNGLSWNANFKWDYIKENLDKPWSWEAISWKKDIKLEDVISHPDKNWDTSGLSRNPNFPPYDVKNYRPCPLSYALNPSFTFKIANDKIYKNCWEGEWFGWNFFKKDQERIMVENAKLHLAAFRIQDRFRNAIVDPTTECGRKKIMKDYDDLFLNRNK